MIKYIVLLFTFTFTGCTVTLDFKKQPAITSVVSNASKIKTACTVYRPLDFEDTPKPPVIDLSNASRNTVIEQKEALVTYIDKLRNYISNYKTVSRLNYTDYLLNCTD